jgi:hypothetical protein
MAAMLVVPALGDGAATKQEVSENRGNRFVGKNVGVLVRWLAALLVSTGIAFAQSQQSSPC